MYKLFVELIQVALGKGTSLSVDPTAEEWRLLFELARKQTLVGVCFAGVERLPAEQRPPREVLMQWYGLTRQIEERNKVMDANEIMWYATQARDAYPYYQHSAIGFNYRMSNVCPGIGRGQMKVLDAHIAHHKHVQKLYEELLADVPGVHIHCQPADSRFDANFWLCAATLDSDVRIVGQENAYKEVVKTAVGGAAGVIHAVDSATTDCQPNDNVEALRVFMLSKKIEARPTWKPMHKQPVYAGAPVYTNGIEEELFKVGFCLPAGPYVSDDDVRYIVECIKEAIVEK